jgi:hypothetical protein
VQQDVPGATVTTERPDRLGDQLGASLLNLFLYRASSNAAWRASDLPTRRPGGEPVQRPCAALDLAFLLSCYGEESELVPQRLLGSAMHWLHSRPVLPRQQVAAAINGRSFLNAEQGGGPRSNLDLQVELVRITPLSLSLEELSKLWSVFFQTPYALSAAYQASVVLIEADLTPPAPLPVREPVVRVEQLRRPQISAVEAAAGPGLPILVTSGLRIRGSDLAGAGAQVRIDDLPPVAPSSVSATAITLQPEALPSGLRAGVHSVQLLYEILLGEPPSPHLGFASNAAAFVLQPQIEALELEGAATLTVQLSPEVGPEQRVRLLLSNRDPAAPAAALSIELLPAEGAEFDPSAFRFPLSAVPAGAYLVRVQVDGAVSQLEVDTDPESASFNQYIGPQVTIP